MVAVDLTSFAKVLGGAKRLEGSGANRPTNVSRIAGIAVEDSADGRVLVDLDAQVFSGDGSQYVELPTSDNVRKGDVVYVDMVGADGKGKSLMISGATGSGDRQQGEIDSAANAAEVAWDWADEAHDAAVDAQQSADAAQASADAAQEDATRANAAANGAVTGLATVQQVVDQLDTDIDDLQAHVAMMDAYSDGHGGTVPAGLHVVPTGAGYFVVIATDGLYVYDSNSNLVSKFGESIDFSSLRPQRIGSNTAYVEFVDTNNDGKPDTVRIGGSVIMGGSKTLTGMLSDLDAAARTATNYVTEVSGDGVWVTPSNAKPVNGAAASTTSGWHISSAIELFRAGVSMLKAWVDGTTTKVRIGAEAAGHIVLDPDGIDFMDASYSIARIARRTGGAILSVGRAMLGEGQNAWLQAYTDNSMVNCGVGASHGLNEGSGMVASVETRAAAGVAQVLMDGKSLTVADNYNDSLMGIYDVPMGHFGKLARCRIDIAFGTATIPANDGTQLTLNFVNGGFDDAGYICAITPMNLTAGFDKCGWCVVSREAGAVRIGAWNNNSYAVTVNVGVIGVDSRYGTVV